MGQMLPLRTVGDTGIALSVLGFGAGGIGNLYKRVEEETALGAVTAALEAGITYFDTAPRYGHGLSERRLGASLPSDVTLSTKVGRRLSAIPVPPEGTERHGFVDGDPFEEHFDYSYDGVMGAFEDSKVRLKRAHVDILFVHDIGRLTHGDLHKTQLDIFLQGGLQALLDLKAQGAIGAIGLGVNEIEVCNEILDHTDLDLILLAGRYTLLEQTSAESFLLRCHARGVSIVAAAPFNSGILINGLTGSAHPYYNYAPPPREIVARVERLQTICTRHDVPLAAAALQFPLAHPSVVSVLPGMGSARSVNQNAAWLKVEIPRAFWAELKEEQLVSENCPTP